MTEPSDRIADLERQLEYALGTALDVLPHAPDDVPTWMLLEGADERFYGLAGAISEHYTPELDRGTVRLGLVVRSLVTLVLADRSALPTMLDVARRFYHRAGYLTPCERINAAVARDRQQSSGELSRD